MTEKILTSRDLFFRELREQTSYYHTKLEDTMLSRAILSEEVTIDQYSDYLKTMYAFVKPFEQVYFPLLKEVFANVSGRERTSMLEKDLEKLGVAGEMQEFIDFDTAQITLPQAVGAMYVMEGSSLGGRVILKQVHKTLGLAEDTGAGYFYGYGAETGKMWTSFLDEMWAFTEETGTKEEIIAGAVKAFESMYKLFSRNSAHAI